MRNYRLKMKVKLGLCFAFITAVTCLQQACGGFNPEHSNLGEESLGSVLNARATYKCSSPSARGMANTKGRRLTKNEMLDSLTDLFGSAVMSNSAVASSAGQIPDESIKDLVVEFQPFFVTQALTPIFALSEAIATNVLSSATVTTQIFGSCATSSSVSEACVTDFLNKTGLKILRRPVPAARQTKFKAVFNSAGGGKEGLKAVLMTMLMAPEFLYHLELGQGNCTDITDMACAPAAAQDGKTPLDHYEIASRISYSVTGSTPDDTLLAMAAQGKLRSIEAVRAEVIRLLENPRARARLSLNFNSWMNLSHTMSDPSPIMASAFGIDGVGLNSEGKQELFDYVNYEILDNKADFKTFMADNVGFPRSNRMAKLMGSSGTTNNNRPVTIRSEYGGILLRPSVLTNTALTNTGPIQRGIFVRRHLLCDVIDLPPASAGDFVASLDPSLMDNTLHPTRDIAKAMTSPQACQKCHSTINPAGYALEGFDPLGQPRTQELVYNAAGSVVKSWPVNPVVENPNLEAAGPRILNNSREFKEALAVSFKMRACMAQRFVSFARLRAIDATQDGCALSDVESALLSGMPVHEALVRSVANTDIFWRKYVGGN